MPYIPKKDKGGPLPELTRTFDRGPVEEMQPPAIPGSRPFNDHSAVPYGDSWADFIARLMYPTDQPNTGRSSNGGTINLNPITAWTEGLSSPGRFEQETQTAYNNSIQDADALIAKMRANNAMHRKKIESIGTLPQPAQVIASRKLQGQR